MRVYNLTAAQYALSNIALRRLKVARYDQLNDPFELLAVDVASRDLRVGILAKKTQVHLQEGLICFSRSWKNPLLWSHYAEKHAGIGLGFDIPDNLLVPVNYVQGLQKLNVLSSQTSQQAIDNFLDRLRYTKFKGWIYEEELRQFVSLTGLEDQSGLYFRPFGEDLLLREVILGPRCDIPIKLVRNLIAGFSQKIVVSKARIAYTKFGVVEDRSCREKKSA